MPSGGVNGHGIALTDQLLAAKPSMSQSVSLISTIRAPCDQVADRDRVEDRASAAVHVVGIARVGNALAAQRELPIHPER